jgi:DNA gyrase subunit A
MLISQNGQMICIGASDLRVIGRNTQGVRLFNLNDGDKIVSAAVLDAEEAPETAPVLDAVETPAEGLPEIEISEDSEVIDELETPEEEM